MSKCGRKYVQVWELAYTNMVENMHKCGRKHVGTFQKTTERIKQDSSKQWFSRSIFINNGLSEYYKNETFSIIFVTQLTFIIYLKEFVSYIKYNV